MLKQKLALSCMSPPSFLKSWSHASALKFVVFILTQKAKITVNLFTWGLITNKEALFTVYQFCKKVWERSKFLHFLWWGTCPGTLNLKIPQRHWNDTAAEKEHPNAHFSFLRIWRRALCIQSWSSSCSWGWSSSSWASFALTCFTAPLLASTIGVEAFRGTGWCQWCLALKV